jgi:peptidoglycan hydrolase CwlO-like protein|tara:strand:+ start:400 stop:624 length:225 start_codon:yes stop_codon:yes gene_type:complete
MEELLNTRVRKRSEDLTGDWTPFVNNIEDILSEIKEIKESIDDLDNKIGETTGMVKNLRKILIKLEVIDDRFIF